MVLPNASISFSCYNKALKNNSYFDFQEVAIKKMKSNKSKEFYAELKALCKIHHINIVSDISDEVILDRGLIISFCLIIL